MKRLLKISFDQALLSLTPILTWFCLSILIDRDLINVFTIVYPLQMLYGVIRAPFATGANISRVKDKNKHAAMSGMILGIILTVAVFGFVLLNVDGYITFMSVDSATYRTFTIYAIGILILQTIFSFILERLYYENKNSQANRYSVVFNILSFAAVIVPSMLTKNQTVIVTIALGIMSLMTLIVLARTWQRFKFKLNLLHCLKYDSVTLASYTVSFFVFLFGLSNALEFGPQYGLAITFVSLITDTQWDVFDSVATLARIDISKHQFNFKQSLRNAYRLNLILFATIAIMFLTLQGLYELDLGITLAYLSMEILTFLIDPAQYLYTSYLQLNWSASKTTTNKIVARCLRLGLSLLPSPFCTSIGMVACSIYQLVSTKILFRKNYAIDKTGKVYKRRRKHQHVALQPQYDELVIDK